jgi:hypothetical protein
MPSLCVCLSLAWMIPTQENERTFLAIDPKIPGEAVGRMDMRKKKYTMTVRMYKVEKKTSMRRSTSRWPVSHIGFDAVNTAQKAVGPDSTCRPQDVKRP